ncbi:MAG TPA: PQQ-binding-like beta-propeller repeat protein [Phototrophicaceae bacterium]|jgi:outer membrane protein assembly factor BamB|nr:PQQ-binding-like beta-propeller repeat protein [Phototrophicaceae bacterium]
MRTYFKIISLMAGMIFPLIYFATLTLAQTTPSDAMPLLLYRGDAGRTGVASASGLPIFTAVKWRRTVMTPAFTPTLYGDLLLMGDPSGKVLALDVETGEVVWMYDTGTPSLVSAIAVADDLLYFGSGDQSPAAGLYVVDGATGEQRWFFPTDGSIWSSTPLIDKGLVYFGSDQGTFYAVNLQTRQEVWTYTMREGVHAWAAAEANTVYCADASTLYAFDAMTGDLLWQVAQSADWLPLAVAGDVIYAGTDDHVFHALNAQTGEESWSFKDRRVTRSGWSAPVVADGMVYAGNRTGVMYSFDAATGDVLWKFQAEDAATSDPVLANGILYFGVGAHGPGDDAAKRSFYALDAASGELLWTFEGEGLVYTAPVVGEGVVYFHTIIGNLYALN